MTSLKLILQIHHSTHQVSYIIHRDLTLPNKVLAFSASHYLPPLVAMFIQASVVHLLDFPHACKEQGRGKHYIR